jgi:hypothetical protein
MNNKKIYKLEAFNEKQERHRTLYIGEALACFKMRDKDSLMHEWDTNRYYLTGFVNGVYQTIELDSSDQEFTHNLG